MRYECLLTNEVLLYPEDTRGKLNAAQRVVIFGPKGIGKTSLAAQFPDPVFINTEGSTRNFDVARYPVPNCWENLVDLVKYASPAAIQESLRSHPPRPGRWIQSRRYTKGRPRPLDGRYSPEAG